MDFTFEKYLMLLHEQLALFVGECAIKAIEELGLSKENYKNVMFKVEYSAEYIFASAPRYKYFFAWIDNKNLFYLLNKRTGVMFFEQGNLVDKFEAPLISTAAINYHDKFDKSIDSEARFKVLFDYDTDTRYINIVIDLRQSNIIYLFSKYTNLSNEEEHLYIFDFGRFVCLFNGEKKNEQVARLFLKDYNLFNPFV